METNEIVMSGRQLKKLLEKKSEFIMSEYGLRPVELDLLVFLDRETNIDTAKEIVERKHLSKAHISKAIENLRDRGFIQIVEDEADHRIMHLRLTEKSDEVVVKMKQILKECKEIMQSGISLEELEIVKKVFAKINQNINRELE